MLCWKADRAANFLAAGAVVGCGVDLQWVTRWLDFLRDRRRGLAGFLGGQSEAYKSRLLHRSQSWEPFLWSWAVQPPQG